MRRLLFICLAVLLLVLPLSACTTSKYEEGYIRYNDRWVTQEEYNRLTGATASTPSQPTTPAQSPSQSFQSITITGTDSKTTQPFMVDTNEWIVEWEYEPQKNASMVIFSFFIYPRGETTNCEKAIITETAKGSTYCYAEPGEYYLEVMAANLKNWQITIKLLPPYP